GDDPVARRAHHEAVARCEMIQLQNISKRFLSNVVLDGVSLDVQDGETVALLGPSDRKSTRLNSSHGSISYAVFCLKKKKIRYRLYGVSRCDGSSSTRCNLAACCGV